MNKINLAEQFSRIDDRWCPRIAAELNGQHVKLAKISRDQGLYQGRSKVRHPGQDKGRDRRKARRIEHRHWNAFGFG